MNTNSGRTLSISPLAFVALNAARPLLVRGILGALLVTLVGLSQPAPGSSQVISKTFVGTWKETRLQLTPQPYLETLSLERSDTGEVRPYCSLTSESDITYSYLSPVQEARYPFIAAGFHWEGDMPAGANVRIDLRTSQDGATWTDWLPTEEVDALRGSGSRDTDLVFSSGRYLQYRVAVEGVPSGVPILREVKVTYIDARNGPSAGEAAATAEPPRRLAALTRPSIINRGAWGADEKHRYFQGALRWPPSYVPAQKIMIHHTATSNDPVDPAAAIRAIYYYHTVTLGWGDIGYNFLIDASGRVYEGRYGGPNVVAGHAYQYNPGSVGVGLLGNFTATEPPPKALEALGAFLLAKSVEYGIDPTGRSRFVDKDLPNIMGHRDALNTACPGERLYAQLSPIRDKTQADLPEYGQAWISHEVPKALEPGSRLTVPITVRNSGKAIWGIRAPNLTRLGYRWYLPSGIPYRGEPGMEYHTDLPVPVAPRGQVTVLASLRTPAQAGVYRLRWDMVQEQVTWFADQGNQPLEQTVIVAPWVSLPTSELVTLPNDLLALLPPERLRTLPLARLTLFSNTELVELIPDIIPLFPNERVLSFSNDILLRYLPDNRLKSFALERIRTFPLDVQQRLGLAPTPTPTPIPSPTVSPALTATPTATSVSSPTPMPTTTSTPTPTPTSTPAPPVELAATATATTSEPGGAVAP